MKKYKNKILFLIIFTFSLLFINSLFSKASASTYTVVSPVTQKVYNLPEYAYLDNYPYKMIYFSPEGDDGYFVCVVGNNEFSLKENYNRPGVYDRFNSSNAIACHSPFTEWGGGVNNDIKLGYIVYSNFDVKDTNGTVVFQAPPRVELVTPMEVEQIPELIQKVLMILVPAGLIIFSVFLLVYLIKSRIWRPW